MPGLSVSAIESSPFINKNSNLVYKKNKSKKENGIIITDNISSVKQSSEKLRSSSRINNFMGINDSKSTNYKGKDLQKITKEEGETESIYRVNSENIDTDDSGTSGKNKWFALSLGTLIVGVTGVSLLIHRMGNHNSSDINPENSSSNPIQTARAGQNYHVSGASVISEYWGDSTLNYITEMGNDDAHSLAYSAHVNGNNIMTDSTSTPTAPQQHVQIGYYINHYGVKIKDGRLRLVFQETLNNLVSPETLARAGNGDVIDYLKAMDLSLAIQDEITANESSYSPEQRAIGKKIVQDIFGLIDGEEINEEYKQRYYDVKNMLRYSLVKTEPYIASPQLLLENSASTIPQKPTEKDVYLSIYGENIKDESLKCQYQIALNNWREQKNVASPENKDDRSFLKKIYLCLKMQDIIKADVNGNTFSPELRGQARQIVRDIFWSINKEKIFKKEYEELYNNTLKNLRYSLYVPVKKTSRIRTSITRKPVTPAARTLMTPAARTPVAPAPRKSTTSSTLSISKGTQAQYKKLYDGLAVNFESINTESIKNAASELSNEIKKELKTGGMSSESTRQHLLVIRKVIPRLKSALNYFDYEIKKWNFSLNDDLAVIYKKQLVARINNIHAARVEINRSYISILTK